LEIDALDLAAAKVARLLDHNGGDAEGSQELGGFTLAQRQRPADSAAAKDERNVEEPLTAPLELAPELDGLPLASPAHPNLLR
tara:strand:+ start:740 stop:988 length:249 start_codon:yes stop_codon:yes gene_type:complete